MWKTLSFNALVLLHAVVSSGLAQESVPSGIVELGRWIPTSINSSGVVVGGDRSDGYVYWNNEVKHIGALGFSRIHLMQINDSNTVVGGANTNNESGANADVTAIKFKLTTAGVQNLTRIGDNGYLNGSKSCATAINNSNTIVGGSTDRATRGGGGFKLDGTSVLKLDGTAWATGISDNGTIVGHTLGLGRLKQEGFLTVNGLVTNIAGTSGANAIDKSGKFVVGINYIYEVSTNKLTRIPTPSGYSSLELVSVNSRGIAVGHASLWRYDDAIVYSLSTGETQILSRTMFPGNCEGSYLTGINDNGDMCGVYADPQSGLMGFVYHP